MMRDVPNCNSFDYGDAKYWDIRYVKDANSFDWYQPYSSLRPLLRKFIPTSSRLLMVGCGNAVISEDMVKDGYEEIVNIDISSVAIEIMKRNQAVDLAVKPVISDDMVKDGYEEIVNIDISSVSIEIMKQNLQMDVRDMYEFTDETFDSVVDKGTLDALMCGIDAPTSSSQMLNEVKRLLKPGGYYIMITYGDPTVRMACLKRSFQNWKITLHVIPRPGFNKRASSSSTENQSIIEVVPLTEEGLLPRDYVLKDPDCHFIYVCQKPNNLPSKYTVA